MKDHIQISVPSMRHKQLYTDVFESEKKMSDSYGIELALLRKLC